MNIEARHTLSLGEIREAVKKQEKIYTRIFWRKKDLESTGTSTDIRAGTSLEFTKSVGQDRVRIEKGITILQVELDRLNRLIGPGPKDYFNGLLERQRKLAELSTQFYKGEVTEATLREAQNEFEQYRSPKITRYTRRVENIRRNEKKIFKHNTIALNIDF